MMSPLNHELLNQVLVLTGRKNFWASEECKVFPNRIYSKYLMRGSGRWGSSRNPINNISLLFEGYLFYLRYKPKVILFGSAPRVSYWFARLKQLGFLPGVRLIAAGALYLDDQISQHFDKLYVYSRAEIKTHNDRLQDKFVFIPLPADGDYSDLTPLGDEEYLFSGGGAGRDFPILIESVRGLDIKLKIVTFSPEKLEYTGDLPPNCEVFWRMPPQSFLQRMAGARFVVVPLKKGDTPHGHTTVVQAVRMGKAVITTNHASVGDYVFQNENGILVEPGNVQSYRRAIQELWDNDVLRQSFEQRAHNMAADLTYTAYARRLVDLCMEVMEEDAAD